MRRDAKTESASTRPDLTSRQRAILDCITRAVGERGYPPSVREIGEAVGLGSPSTVHAHLESLERLGFIRRDPTKPRAIEVFAEPVHSDAERRPMRLVPLIGDVAAGVNVLAEQQVEELLPLPADLTGEGELFMLRVRGDSMIEVGIFDGDYVVARVQSTADLGDIVVAGLPGGEATVKSFSRRDGNIVLIPANATMEPLVFSPDEVTIYGKAVTVMRRL